MPSVAHSPEELGRLFVERANAGDLEGLVSLHEAGAVVAFPPGSLSAGHDEIRATYAAMLADRPRFTPGTPQPTLRNGELALTSTRLDGGGLTVEVARRQADGTWRWVIDNPVAAVGVDHGDVTRWVDTYERLWRAPGVDGLASLFTDDATYSKAPYEEPVVGLPAIGRMWEEERDGPDEPFRMTSEVVTVGGDTAVVRVEVWYGDPVTDEYRDLWVIRFAGDGRCSHFEEWPFAPGG
jgi:ketosteroid isomerase-like protein